MFVVPTFVRLLFLSNIKVADFGGTLSLFLGVSFFTVIDNFYLVTKAYRMVFNNQQPENTPSVQLPEERSKAWE